MNQRLLRVVEAGLVIAIWAGVLAFGGTSPAFFLPTQIIILGLGVFLLSVSFYRPVASTRLPFVVPMLLVALVVLQILPLPPFLARLASVDTVLANGVRPTLSFAPYRTVSQLLLLVTYLTAFCMVLLVKEEPKAKKRLVYALVALGAFEAFYGLVQYLTGWQQIFLYVKKYYLQEATGTYINRNHFAGLLEMTLPLTLALALYFAGKLRAAAQDDEVKWRNISSSPQLFPLVFLLFLSGLILTALVFSRSRMGIIAAIVSVLTVLALAGSSSVSRRTRTLAAMLFALGVVGVVLWLGSDPVIMRFETLGHEYDTGGQNRLSIWRDTFALIRRYPLFGTGFGTFAVAYTSVQTAFLTLLVDHAHCDYLEVVSELGVPGGLLLFSAILWIFIHAVRGYKNVEADFERAVCLGGIGGVTAILLHSFVDFNLYIPANALVFTVLLALIRTGRKVPNARHAPLLHL